MHAGWETPFFHAVGAEIAKMGGVGQVGVLPLAVNVFPWTVLKHVHAELPLRKVEMLFAGDFATMATRAVLVVDEQAVVFHQFPLLFPIPLQCRK